jgi:hypothetical protein
VSGPTEQGRLPTFLVVGAMRAGTTSLSRLLGSHPDVYMPPRKEIHFFDRRWRRGTDWYRRWFAEARGRRAVGESTPSYMYLPEVPPRMAQVVPQARLVAILRDPVDRAYSHYWHEQQLGHEDLSFLAAIRSEPDRLGGDPSDRGRHAYLDRGRYLSQLQRLHRFFPPERLLVLIFEDFRADPRGTFTTLCRFLDIDEAAVPRDLGRNWTVHTLARSARVRAVSRRLPWRPLRRAVNRLNARRWTPPPLDPEVRADVVERFREDNRALSAWLGRPLPWS